ncbi:alpha/beta fold hydrolase [Caulobacter sp. 17J80-11]|uniref:alpha/beta fold hydrolase n=1 Tax=Caulobacter sp. 17J80-11 TaxID=2763502 RepID=UPI0016537C02|nr:alpha/beta hydrolase [Caulobacter sp. 17J80-11]MBC6981365.1 alpha/beta hydrolase [Caulobacter sp. 17J80-11]
MVPSHVPAAEAETRELCVDTPDGRLYARVWGELAGPRAPIVLLHDSLGSVAQWRDFPERLAQATGRAVVAYDRLGFGRSDPHPRLLQPDFVHDEARAGLTPLRAALEIGPMVLFGHSVGGGMALSAAAALPDVRAVVSESAQAFVEDVTLAGVREAKAAFARPGQVERLERWHGDKARWVLDAWIETWLDEGRAGWRLDEDLRAVRCPVLAMHGDKDEFGSPAHPQRIGALPSGPTRVVLMDDTGHVPHRERPEAVLAEVSAFLEGVG